VRAVAHLTRAEAKRMARKLHAVLVSARARPARRSNERYALTVAMVPLTKAE
jgi:hypothetical protein